MKLERSNNYQMTYIGIPVIDTLYMRLEHRRVHRLRVSALALECSHRLGAKRRQVLFIKFRKEVVRRSVCNCVKKHQFGAQLFLSVFRPPLHVSVVSRPIIRRYNRICTTIVTYYSF